MPVLTIHKGKTILSIRYKPDSSLYEILNKNDIKIRSGCGGTGKCGLCRVEIENQGILPACRVWPENDLNIKIGDKMSLSAWRIISNEEHMNITIPQFSGQKFSGQTGHNTETFGAAVDLGTTHIRVSIRDMKNNFRIGGCTGLNPQTCFGADVLTRLLAASESDNFAQKMKELVQNAINDAIMTILESSNISLQYLNQVAIVGNTAMLALLVGKGYEKLIQADAGINKINFIAEETISLFKSLNINPNACVKIIQPQKGFVGSDLLAGILAVKLIEGPPGSLFIDFGTNSEIGLWDGNILWTSSAAGGPAFEGSGISCGMPAEPGAIFSVSSALTGTADKTLEPVEKKVIGGLEAKGFCGSGLVDIIACMLNAGIIKSNGRFVNDIDKKGLKLFNDNEDIFIKKQDIDIFQRAKGAIGSGIECLLNKAGINFQNIKRICVCGAFGKYLNISNAQALGLLPPMSSEKIELYANTALAGCELLLFDQNSKNTIDILKKKCKNINLAKVPLYEDLFIKNLFLRPMKSP